MPPCANDDVLLKRIRVRPSILIAFLAVCGALVCGTRLAPLARITEGNLHVQDFAYHYLLAGVTNLTGDSSPYAPEDRRTRLEALCIGELGVPCDLSNGSQPVALSPIGFVELLGLSKVCGSDSRGALLGYTLLIAATFCAWMLLGWRLFQLSKQNTFFLLPFSVALGLTITSPLDHAVIHGQPSFLVVALVALAILTERHKNPGLVASALVLAALKPHYFVPACALFAAAREWRAILWASVGILALAVLAGSIYGASIVTEYPAVLRDYASGMRFSWFDNPFNLQHYLPLSSHFVTSAGGVLAILLSAWSVWRGSITGSSLLPLVYILFSPYAARYELAVLIIPALGVVVGKLNTTCQVNDKPCSHDKGIKRVEIQRAAATAPF